MEVNYKQKYLKYKEKYLKLKAQTGGGLGKCTKCNNNNCDAFVSQRWINVTGPGFTDTQRNEVYTMLVKENPNCFRQECKHKFSEHM